MPTGKLFKHAFFFRKHEKKPSEIIEREKALILQTFINLSMN